MFFFGFLLWSVYLFSERRWREIQFNLMPLFLWHAANVLLLTDLQSGNYEYYLIVFGIILLFLPYKEFFLKLSLVSLYVVSTVAKIHPAWIEGGYFTAMRTGLPFFPDWSIPFWTNLVMVMEMVGAWFLMSKNVILQRTALGFFVLFHLYSGILVEYRYPATVLPMLLIMFGPWYRHTPVPLNRRSIAGWFLILSIFAVQFTPRLIEGDEKLTLEGNKYGLYMFETNHQCISQATAHYADGTVEELDRVSASARNRCEPYSYWFVIQQACERFKGLERMSWKFDHSINGDPFLRIVDTENACNLEYKAFSHNQWIKTEADNPEIIGYPVKNYYH
jgi:hypothetical protein